MMFGIGPWHHGLNLLVTLLTWPGETMVLPGWRPDHCHYAMRQNLKELSGPDVGPEKLSFGILFIPGIPWKNHNHHK